MKAAADAENLRSQGIDVVDFSAGRGPTSQRRDNIKAGGYSRASNRISPSTPRARRHDGIEAGEFASGTRRTSAPITNRPECIVSGGRAKHVIFNLTQAIINEGGRGW